MALWWGMLLLIAVIAVVVIASGSGQLDVEYPREGEITLYEVPKCRVTWDGRTRPTVYFGARVFVTSQRLLVAQKALFRKAWVTLATVERAPDASFVGGPTFHGASWRADEVVVRVAKRKKKRCVEIVPPKGDLYRTLAIHCDDPTALVRAFDGGGGDDASEDA